MKKDNKELMDSIILHEVTIKYNTDPNDEESINIYIRGTLDKTFAGYKVDAFNRKISFSPNNIKRVEINFHFYSNREEIIIHIEKKNKR